MNEDEKIPLKLGYYVSLLTAIVTTATFVIAFLTPPLSGPFCTANCFEYPYMDIASRFPRDYYWMCPTIFISILFVTLMITIHYVSDRKYKIFSHLGIAFSVISAGILILNYYTQLSVIQTSLKRKV